MPGVERLTKDNNYFDAPNWVIMQGLRGVSVGIAPDSSLRPGSVALDLKPPESFDARYASSTGSLRVTSAAGQSGGEINLRVGPEAAIGHGEVWTTEARVCALGTSDWPLVFGDLSLGTTGAGAINADNAIIEGNLRVISDNSRATVGMGVVVTGQLIQSTPQ